MAGKFSGVTVAVLVVFVVVLSMTFISRRAYFDYSLERHKLCLSGAKELYLSGYDCTQITAAADAAYNSATGHVVPALTMIVLLAFGLVFRLNKLEKELASLKENADV